MCEHEASKGTAAIIQARGTHSLDQEGAEEMREENALGYVIWKGKQSDLLKKGKGKIIKTEISDL